MFEFLKFHTCKRFTQELRNTGDVTEEQVAMIFHSPHDNRQNIFLPLPTKSPCRSSSLPCFCIFRTFAAPQRRKLVVFLTASPFHNDQRYYIPKLTTSYSLCNLSQNFFRLISSMVQAVVDWRIFFLSNSFHNSQRRRLVQHPHLLLSPTLFRLYRIKRLFHLQRKYHKSLVAFAVLRQGSANGFIDQLFSVSCFKNPPLRISS